MRGAWQSRWAAARSGVLVILAIPVWVVEVGASHDVVVVVVVVRRRVRVGMWKYEFGGGDGIWCKIYGMMRNDV